MPAPEPSASDSFPLRFGSRSRVAAAFLSSAVCGGCVGPATTHDPPEPRASRTAIALTVDNDFFTGSDNNYTNGVALTSMSGPVSGASENDFSRRWASLWSFLPFFDPEKHEAFVGCAFGQEIFTPDDITLANPPLDDQPYAGVLFLDLTFAGKEPRVCSTWKLRLGVVGPSSFADEVQTTVHDWIDDDEPQGWDTQLGDEPIFNVDYNLAYELTGYHEGEVGLRFVPIGGLSAGNYFTGASAGAYTELGWNLPETVGALSLRQGVDPVALVAATREDEFSISTFLGGGGFAVGHYLPLDGTVFRNSRSVDSEPLVGFVSTGVSIRAGRLAVNYLLSFFSDTFETQRDSQKFGRVTLSWSL